MSCCMLYLTRTLRCHWRRVTTLQRSNITPIDLLFMTETVHTPLQLDTFWASIQNKQGLGPQLLPRELMKEYENVLICCLYRQLEKWIEEGGSRIAPHVAWDIIKPRMWNDTDTVALLLHYIPNVIGQGHEAIVASILNLWKEMNASITWICSCQKCS